MTDPIRLNANKPQEMNFKTLPIMSAGEEKPETTSFSQILKESVLRVNEVQQQADVMTQRLALGEVDDVSEVSIAVEKAELALRMMVQIRDKLVDAYQQIARMAV